MNKKIRARDEEGRISLDEARQLLPPRRQRIHTYRPAGMIVLGCDWTRTAVLAAFKACGPRLAGPHMCAMGHGLAVVDQDGPLFFETREDLDAYTEPETARPCKP